jgi:hypothetical protein
MADEFVTAANLDYAADLDVASKSACQILLL